MIPFACDPRHALGRLVKPEQEDVRVLLKYRLRQVHELGLTTEPQHEARPGRISMSAVLLDKRIEEQVQARRAERVARLISFWSCTVHPDCWADSHKHTIVVEAEARACAATCTCWRHWVTGVRGGTA